MNGPSEPANDDAAVTSEHGSSSDEPPGMPRWVKVSAIIVGILVLLVVLVKVTGVGGEHGPGRHAPNGAGVQVEQQDVRHVTSGEHTPPASVPDHGGSPR